MAAWISKKHHLIAFCLLALFFGPLLWIAQYNYPSGDDYPAYFHARDLGTVGAIRWWYLNWTGRYTSFLVQSLFRDYDTWLVAYKIIPVALFVAGFGCLYHFIAAFFGTAFRNHERVTLTVVAFIFLVGLTPDMATAFYWLPASVLFMGAAFISVLLLALYIDWQRAKTPFVTARLAVAAVVLIALLAGLNEISLVFFVATAAALSGWQLLKRKTFPAAGLTFLVVGVLCGLLAFAAPGNAIRAGQTSANVHLVSALLNAIGLTVYVLLQLLTSPPLLPASALYLAFLESNRDQLRHLRASLSDVRWYGVLAFLVAVTFVSVCIFATVGIHDMAPRVRNVYIYSLTGGWFFF